MNLAIYFQDGYSANLYAVDTGLASLGVRDTVPDADSWDYFVAASFDPPFDLNTNSIPAFGLGISPDGTKFAVAAANAFTKQYKIQVWDVGVTPDVSGTIDGPRLIYSVNATKLTEYTKTFVVQDTVVMDTWVNDGNSSTVDTILVYGVLDIEVDNDGNVHFLEYELSSGISQDYVDANDVNVSEISWTKAHVMSLPVGSVTATLVTVSGLPASYLTYASSGPSNGTFITAENPIRGSYCPTGFCAINVFGLWDGARGRVFGRARENLTNLPDYSVTFTCPPNPPDPAVPAYWQGGTAENMNSNVDGMMNDGIFEPGAIITQNNTGTMFYTGHTVAYNYQDQLCVAVYRDASLCIQWGGYPATFPQPTSVSTNNLADRYPIRRSGGLITANTRRQSQADDDTDGVIVQALDGTVSRYTTTDSLNSATCGYFESSATSPCNTYKPQGIMLGTNRQFIVDANQAVRPVAVVGSTLTLSATPEVISPSNPDTDYSPANEATRTATGGVYGFDVGSDFFRAFFGTGTVNGA